MHSTHQLQHLWEQDADLAICTTCGNQFSTDKGPDVCPICNDDRQYPCPTGQAYTTARKLAVSTSFTLEPEAYDARILRVQLKPPVGIGQTPIVLCLEQGIVIWDCSGFVSVDLIAAIRSLSKRVLGVLISHPHFYGTSSTWAKMLECQVYISALDREWYIRGVTDCVTEVHEDHFSLTPEITMVRCGGHFPGSSVLHWSCRSKGVMLCSDTFMVAMDRKRFTFAYSFPNLIPLPPDQVAKLWLALERYDWNATFGGWTGRNILTDSRAVLLESARYYLTQMGHKASSWI